MPLSWVKSFPFTVRSWNPSLWLTLVPDYCWLSFLYLDDHDIPIFLGKLRYSFGFDIRRFSFFKRLHSSTARRQGTTGSLRGNGKPGVLRMHVGTSYSLCWFYIWISYFLNVYIYIYTYVYIYIYLHPRRMLRYIHTGTYKFVDFCWIPAHIKFTSLWLVLSQSPVCKKLSWGLQRGHGSTWPFGWGWEPLDHWTSAKPNEIYNISRWISAWIGE